MGSQQLDEPIFDLSVRKSSWCSMVTLAGELDVATAPTLAESLDWLCDDGCPQVTVDLSAVTFVDSCGLGTLIAAHRNLTAHGGRLVLSRPRHPVRRLLDVTGLDHEFHIQ